MRKLTLILLAVLLTAGTAYACVKYKQCCMQDFRGLQCITMCDYELCPYNYPIEVR